MPYQEFLENKGFLKKIIMIEVIKGSPDDYTVIRSLAEVIWPHTYSSILSPEQLDYMFDMMYSKRAFEEQLSLKNHHFLLAKDEEKFVGFASYEINSRPDTTKIHKLYVLPDAQGKGVGNILVSRIENIARQHANSCITLNVNRFNPAVKFYLKAGFTKAGQEDISIGNGYLMEDYIMQKEV